MLFLRSITLWGIISIRFSHQLFFSPCSQYLLYFSKHHLLVNIQLSSTLFCIHRAHNIIWYQRYRMHYILYQPCLFYRVIAYLIQQQLYLKSDEIHLIFIDEIDEIRRIIILCIRVWVLAIWQQHHFHIHPLFQQQIYTSNRCLNTCRITII